jgi:hypothetical protein
MFAAISISTAIISILCASSQAIPSSFSNSPGLPRRGLILDYFGKQFGIAEPFVLWWL